MCNGSPCVLKPDKLEYYIDDTHWIFARAMPDGVEMRSTEVCKRVRAYVRLIESSLAIDNTGGIIYRMKCMFCKADHFQYEANRKYIEEIKNE